MSANRLLFRGVLALALSLPALFLGAANAAADADVRTVAADNRRGCVLYPGNKAAARE
ncbi:hypothetical protein [Nocardia farcinica]|uniref:hypothetical protein n=1 Tax=Nocardia farcinica TaxID=37329 RepID=UPI0024562412|nr:hypothetical protein [Nocardia farcinica]